MLAHSEVESAAEIEECVLLVSPDIEIEYTETAEHLEEHSSPKGGVPSARVFSFEPNPPHVCSNSDT